VVKICESPHIVELVCEECQKKYKEYFGEEGEKALEMDEEEYFKKLEEWINNLCEECKERVKPFYFFCYALIPFGW